MGAVYYVKLKLKVKDEEALIKNLVEKVIKDEKEGKAAYVHHPDETFSLDETVGCFLAEHQNMFYINEGKSYTTYESWFDASYGWARVLEEMFECIKECLQDGSYLIVEQDNDRIKYMIKEGKIIIS